MSFIHHKLSQQCCRQEKQLNLLPKIVNFLVIGTCVKGEELLLKKFPTFKDPITPLMSTLKGQDSY